MNSTTTLSSTRSFIELEDEFGAHNYKPLDVVLARGQGRLGLGTWKATNIWICWHRIQPPTKAIAIHAS